MGKVALVGAGPGDPGLITVRGLELLMSADVVVTDYLVDARLKQYIPQSVTIVDVGKRPGIASFSQAAINDELIRLSQAYELVVRLKGGDPFLFGRGGEEVEALLAAGVTVEVVPGVTSALAGPAFVGVPVTHRGLADGYLVITGHRHADVPLDYDWHALVASRLTIVVLMGVAHRKVIADALIDAGMDRATPVAVVQSVTWPQETQIRTTLERLADQIVESPAVLVIGQVASLQLDWRSSLVLSGVNVHLLRPFDQNDNLGDALRNLGARVIHAPAIEIREPSDGGGALREGLAHLDAYDWLLFTSKNAVERTLQLIPDLRSLGRVKVACIGSGTQGALEAYRIGCDLVPPQFVGESLVETFPAGSGRVLFPRAKIARDVVPRGLVAKGWSVDVVEAYQTEIPAPIISAELAATLDVTVFTAASTVTGYAQQYPGVLPRHAVAIGPVTAQRLREQGVAQVVEAREFSVRGLVEAITELTHSDLHH